MELISIKKIRNGSIPNLVIFNEKLLFLFYYLFTGKELAALTFKTLNNYQKGVNEGLAIFGGGAKQ